jgi:hypothetical protein
MHASLKSGAITTWVVATAIRAEIFALPHAVSEKARIGQLTPDLLTPAVRIPSWIGMLLVPRNAGPQAVR